jgi:hypothetical protein
MVAGDHVNVRGHLVTQTGALRAWFTVMLLVVCLGGAMALTITYVTLQQRKICGLVVLLDDRNATLPPADPDTMAFRRELHRYRTGLGCRS